MYEKLSRKELIRRDLKKHKALYLMFLPVLIYFLIFNYAPMAGLVMAFEDYSIKKGIFGSTWVGLKNFTDFFQSYYFFRLLRNTLLISAYGLLFSFPFPIILALLLNEVRSKYFKKTVQTISYLPYFISVVVVVGILQDFCESGGILSVIVQFFGGESGNLLGYAKYFRTLYIGSNIWQHIGYSSIIYFAALSSIDPELYEAARIDGAGRWQQTIHVTLPGLLPTIIIMLILRMGTIMSVGYEKIILMYAPSTYETADVISTYVYRIGLLDANYSYSAAIGMFNSVVNMIILSISNFISRRVSDTSLW